VRTPTEAHAGVRLKILVENDSDLAESLALSVMTTFLPDAIQLTFDTQARMWRTNYVVRDTLVRSNAGKAVFSAELDYDCFLSPNY
jgi:hypothetical protein